MFAKPLAVAAIAAITIVGCRSAQHANATIATEAPAVSDAAFLAQAEAGAGLFANRCAGCHGADGSGGRAPAVIGDGTLPAAPRERSRRTQQLNSAADLNTYIAQNMPPNARARAQMTPDDTLSLVAFLLSSRGVIHTGELTPDNVDALAISN